MQRSFSSAHYFWYLVQTACHAFVLGSDEDNTIALEDFLLLFLHSNQLIKRLYRLFILLGIAISMIYYSTKDPWQMWIIPIGEIPLMLLWILHVTHFFGLASFVIISCSEKLQRKFHLDLVSSPDVESDSISSPSWSCTISMIFIQVNEFCFAIDRSIDLVQTKKRSSCPSLCNC